jgi:hypothetical protein
LFSVEWPKIGNIRLRRRNIKEDSKRKAAYIKIACRASTSLKDKNNHRLPVGHQRP